MNIRRIELVELFPAERRKLLERSAVPDAAIRRSAAEIVGRVRHGGDRSLEEASRTYGGGRALRGHTVSSSEPAEALAALPDDVVSALEAAIDNIRRCHEPQRPTDQVAQIGPGIRVERRWTPLRRVGVYVPGGSAAYPSSLLMGVIPAQIAGVESICVTSPADANGAVSPALLGAAALLGIDEIHIAGGAQAVAALAYGTETIGRVDKIVGPGNAWVTAAKLAVYGDCAVDLPAGPSEALIVADESADPRILAADLLCQAEHGPDSPVFLVTTAPQLIEPVLANIAELLPTLEREQTIRAALDAYGTIVVAPDRASALTFANEFAAEHLSFHTADPAGDAAEVPNAGSVFLGRWTPESAGDYATGANHVLPTGGLARSYSPLSVEDFGSWRQVQELTEEGLQILRPTIGALADAEGLTAHKLCVEVRFEEPGESAR